MGDHFLVVTTHNGGGWGEEDEHCWCRKAGCEEKGGEGEEEEEMAMVSGPVKKIVNQIAEQYQRLGGFVLH